MAVCPYCGSKIPDSIENCPNCGAILLSQQNAAPVQQSANQMPQQPQQQYMQQDYNQPVQQQGNYYPQGNGYGYNNMDNQLPQPVSTGGLLAWSIVSILLCTIPGIVALVNTIGINNARTYEEQQKKMSSARTWCIVATVLGVLYVVFTLIGRAVGG